MHCAVRLVMTCVLAAIAASATLIAPAAAQESKQIRLTETQVKNFIAAQSELAKISGTLEGGDADSEAKLEAALDRIAKANGFAGAQELRDVDFSVLYIFDGLDPQTGEYFDPLEALKAEIEEIKADKEIPVDQKKELITEREEAIKYTPPLEFKENIELVKKYREDIEKALQ